MEAEEEWDGNARRTSSPSQVGSEDSNDRSDLSCNSTVVGVIKSTLLSAMECAGPPVSPVLSSDTQSIAYALRLEVNKGRTSPLPVYHSSSLPELHAAAQPRAAACYGHQPQSHRIQDAVFPALWEVNEHNSSLKHTNIEAAEKPRERRRRELELEPVACLMSLEDLPAHTAPALLLQQRESRFLRR